MLFRSQDQWDGRTLEWSLPVPPPEYNYRVIPQVHARDAFWYEKQNQEQTAAERAAGAKAEEAHGGIHMPYGSIWPFVASMGALVGAIGFTAFDPAPGSAIGPKFIISLAGAAILVIGAYFWALEGNEGYHIHVDEDGNVTEDHQH